VDGSSNKQGSGVVVIQEGPSGLLIEQDLRFAFKANNNQVEYEVVIAGMLLAKELGARSLLVKSDSLLVIAQVTVEYQAKDPQLASYLRYVVFLKVAFSTFELVHVPSEHNSREDLLSKLENSRKGGRQRSVIQETLKSPRTTAEGITEVSHVEVLGLSSEQGRRHRSLTQETLKVPRITTYGVIEEEFMEVLQVNVVETWMTLYQRYLTHGLLPVEPTEAKPIKRNAGKYTLVDGKLFRHGYTHPILTCVSWDQCTRIMAELHEGICGSHVGGRALSLKVV